MKLKGAKQVHYDSGPNMTPLVDVVMVILIFLMLAGSFGTSEHYLLSTTPITKSGVGHDTSTPDKTTPFEILVDSDSPGHYTAQLGDTDCHDAETLKAVLAQKLAGLEANGTKVDDIQVIIGPDVPYKYLIEVYQAALAAEFTKVTFEPEH
jgi:biopolymer transport protein ExbD